MQAILDEIRIINLLDAAVRWTEDAVSLHVIISDPRDRRVYTS